MPTDSLSADLATLLAAKRQQLAERKARTPLVAVTALAQMQRKPMSILNTVSDGSYVTLIGQVTHSETYDPVAATMRYVREGVDAVSLFTDVSAYSRGLDDLLLVSKGVNVPVIAQDYILDDYHVVEMRAAGASALVLSALILDRPALRKVVTVTQRWGMTAMIQVGSEDHLEVAQELSPHVIGIGSHANPNAADDLAVLQRLRSRIPYNTRCMIMTCLQTLDEVQAAVNLGVDAVIVNEKLMITRATGSQLRALLKRSGGDPPNN
jgi:indole-3-glycerol phosphate synthase